VRTTAVSKEGKVTLSIQSLDRGLVILEAVARSRHPVATAFKCDYLFADSDANRMPMYSRPQREPWTLARALESNGGSNA